LLNDDGLTMMSTSVSTAEGRGEVAFAICDTAALATRTQTVLALLQRRLCAFADESSATRRLSAEELQQLGALGEEVAELAAQVALTLDGLPLDPLRVTEREIADSARTALADGIVDDRRARTAAGFLAAEEGFPALADALTEADAHAYWTARVIDVLAAFRDVDTTRARQVAALAGVPSEGRFCELRPERVLELAHVLRQLAAR
jgi:hypothetical protein